ncbi:hypothetical protein RHSIM_Rhsim03G0172600 [Rhododendron simsii]|uniref:Uncharacterized protein n=1 Tax=Rhododendron simsii TaxID=118357 RepID=A0A834LRY6_RHOSS|nr:hypothetical protein RHSIM_Rhsim03G0172600 [Rhododendron simsii]
MASETFAQPAIPRFDGHYDHWSMLMENFLRSKEYWTVVVSGVAEPAEGVVLTDAQKAELEGLKLKDLKAKNYLFQAIDRSILETILCKDNAKHIWDSMKKPHQKITLQQVELIEDEEAEVEVEEAEATMVVETNNINSIKRINFKEEEEDVVVFTQLLMDRSQQTSPMLNATNVIEKEEEVSLLMVCHVKEETPQNMWYLDTGCSNHMCGDKKLFSNLDESFHSTVKFGDNSTVAVMGKGSVTIQPKGNLTHTISNVLFVPDLKTNLLSVGQLQEKGYEISIKGGVCQIQDAKLGLIAQVNMTANRMFPLHLHNTNHSCFSAKVRDAAWLWHFRYGHLNFGGLKTLQQKNMVIGLPQIAAPSGVCEECVVSKQHLNWSTHVLNRSPTLAVQNMTPEEAWSGRKPAVDHFRIFGCVAYAHIPDQKRKKLDDKGEKCIFLGVSDQSKAYKLYNPITKKILISRDVIFDEAQTWPWNTNVVEEQIPTSFDGEDDDDAKQSQQQLVPAIAGLENPQNEAPMASEITPTTPEVDEQVEAAAGSRSHRVRKRPAWMSDYEVPGIDQSDDPLTHFALFSDCDPTVFESAMKNCNSVSTPTEFGLKLTKDHDGKKVDSTLYKQIVGSLMYLTATRPDIMYSVSLISRYMENPTELHLLVAKRIFRYLQGTWKFGLFYKKGERSDLRGFTDSDYAGDQDDRRSTSGYVFMLGSGAVSWSSKKQPIVTLSTTEAEFVAATSCVCQAIWLKKILEELYFKRQGAITIFCDNSSAIKLSKNPVLHGRSKHIDVKFHFLRDHTKDGTIDLIFCKSEDQVADIMTKPLKLGMFMKLQNLLGICSMENPI